MYGENYLIIITFGLERNIWDSLGELRVGGGGGSMFNLNCLSMGGVTGEEIGLTLCLTLALISLREEG